MKKKEKERVWGRSAVQLPEICSWAVMSSISPDLIGLQAGGRGHNVALIAFHPGGGGAKPRLPCRGRGLD